jgi:hypothetical protein
MKVIERTCGFCQIEPDAEPEQCPWCQDEPCRICHNNSMRKVIELIDES